MTIPTISILNLVLMNLILTAQLRFSHTTKSSLLLFLFKTTCQISPPRNPTPLPSPLPLFQGEEEEEIPHLQHFLFVLVDQQIIRRLVSFNHHSKADPLSLCLVLLQLRNVTPITESIKKFCLKLYTCPPAG